MRSRHAVALTKGEAAYLEIRAQIIEGTLPPGGVFSQEGLASSMGFSTTPLREALRRLQAEGLVELQAHRDMIIAPLSLRELHELYGVRLRLDPEAASLAARAATDRHLDEIVRLARKPTSGTAQSRLKTNRAFHRAIYSASGNQLLTDLLDSLWDRTDRYRLLLLQDEEVVDAAGREHIAIARALRKRDSEGVAQLVYDHMEAAERMIVDAVEASPLLRG